MDIDSDIICVSLKEDTLRLKNNKKHKFNHCDIDPLDVNFYNLSLSHQNKTTYPLYTYFWPIGYTVEMKNLDFRNKKTELLPFRSFY